MDWWQWLISGGVSAICTIISRMAYIAIQERKQFEDKLQETIDRLRLKMDEVEKDIRKCIEDRAAIRQELSDLKQSL